MKTIITASVLALSFLASSAYGAPKRSVQYEVAAIDPGGKLGVYEVCDKRPEAMAIARYLEGKDKAHRHFFVVVEEIDAKGDVASR